MTELLMGFYLVGGVGGWVLAVIGLVPIAAGVFNLCLLGPLFGGPLQGSKIKALGEMGDGRR